MKPHVCIFIVPVILLCGIFSLVSCSKNEQMKLSELGDEALLQYLDNEDISIPNGIQVSSIRKMISELEADPDRHPIIVSWAAVIVFYEELRVLVKKHSGLSP